MRVYFQIQYGDRHSDSCMEYDDPHMREVMHKLLDEFLDKKLKPTAAELRGSDKVLDQAHLLFCKCTEH